MNYCLDTNICIYALKGNYPNVLRHFKEFTPDQIKIPAMVRAELLYGAEKSNQPVKTRGAINKFLYPYEIISFNNTTADVYAKVRFSLEQIGNVIGPNDLIIAATALAHNAVLVTHNVKEFGRVNNLKIEDWT